MNISQKILHHRDTFNPRFKEYFENLNNRLSFPNKSIYPKICVDLIKDLSLVGGKRQRVAYLYEAFSLGQGTKITSSTEKHLTACAISIELLQTHLLIHDDIVDNSPIRRGSPTTLQHLIKKTKLDNNIPLGMAIMAGDIAAYLALDVLHSCNLPPKLLSKIVNIQTTAGIDTFLGQIFDLERDMPNTLFNEDSIIELADFKASRSSTLAPMLIGISLSSQDTTNNINIIRKYATSVGIAGQLQDDYLGMFGDPEKTGKSNISDLKEGKRTLLITKTLETCNNQEKKIISQVLGNPTINHKQANMVKEIIKKYHVDILLKKTAQKYAQLAYSEAKSWSHWNKEAVDFFAESAKWFINRTV